MFVGKYICGFGAYTTSTPGLRMEQRALALPIGTCSLLSLRILVPRAPRVAHSSRSVHGRRFHMDKQCPQWCQIWVRWPTPSAVDQPLGYSSLHCHHLLTCLLWQHSFLSTAHTCQILLFPCLPVPFSTLLVGLGQFRHYIMLLSPLVKCDVFLFLNQSI